MADDKPSMEEKLAQLQAQYALKIVERIDALQATFRGFVGGQGSARQDALHSIRDATHKLAGSGATFGFPEISVAARKIEQACVAAIETGSEGSPDLVKHLEAMLEDLSKASLQQGDTPHKGDTPKVVNANVDKERVRSRESVPDLHGSSRQKVLFVMPYDGAIAMQTILEMDHFGFDARIVDHPSKILDDLHARGAANVIVTDLVFAGDEDVAISALKVLRDTSQFKDIPVVVHTELDSFASRLSAVRVGVSAYLVKPVDMADMIDVLDQVTHRHEDEPYRVLVVDDDESIASHTELVLQGAGMETRMTTDPMNLFDVLDDFSPELILLDLYMPGCDGQEIAAVVRQREEYAGIPIVFLSGEADKDKQLSAMELGGDDFLTKPIRASHLISSVRIRVTRFRELRAFMVRDSMTGLFNHTTTKQLLDNEISRTQRSGGELALVALDIDHFKNVNDSYGHSVGDRVIKALARLMRQRLRSADVIGRMGGEEFAAILPDSGVDEAFQVFDTIRQAFSEIVFHADGQTFNVTLSCGVAAFPRHDTATVLSDEADKALYTAKHGGRNQVVKAD